MKELLSLLEKYKKITVETDEVEDKRRKTLTELERAEKALAKARAEDAVEIQKLRVQTAELNKENKDAAKSALNLITPYQKFAKEVSEAKAKAKNLGAEMILLEKRFKSGEISSKEYNSQINKLSKEYVEAKVKASGLDAQIKKIDSAVGDSQRNVGNYKSAITGLTGSFKNLLAAFGVVSAIDMFADLMKSSYETVKKLNAQNLALQQVFESEAQVASQKQYLSDLTNRYGLELVSTTDAYVKFSAAVKGTYLEGEKARDIFSSFAGASAKLGLSATETEGIMKALEQIISKGKIQAEELRGQLGDRMAGAFRLFASAIGVSTAELDNMLKSGEVYAEDVLPKVAENLEKTYSLSNTEKIDSLAAAQNRLSNGWTNFLDQIAGNEDVINSLAVAMEFLAESIKTTLEELITGGDDGISVVKELTETVDILTDTLKNLGVPIISLPGPIANLKIGFNLVNMAAVALKGSVQILILTIENLIKTILNPFDVSGFIERLSKVQAAIKDTGNEIKELNNQNLRIFTNIDKEYAETKAYQKAWTEAKKAKQAYFQFNGKYFTTQTGKNTGKSLDDYIDKDGTLIKKEKARKNTNDNSGDDEKAAKKSENARKKAAKDAEREAEKQRRIAYQNAKSEIEARKLALDFIYKSYDEEKALSTEKDLFYKHYYAERFALMEEEEQTELQYAKSGSEKNKIIEKYNLERLALEKEKKEKLKEIQLQVIDDEEKAYKLSHQSQLDKAIDLTDKLVENEKEYVKKISEFQIKSLNVETGFNEKELQNKLDLNEKLTTAEMDYLLKLRDIRENGNTKLLNIDKKYADAKYNIQKMSIENEKLQQGKWFDTNYASRTEYATKLYEAELKLLNERLKNGEITQNEYDKRSIGLKLEYNQEVLDIDTEFWETQLGSLGEAFDKQTEMQQIANATLDLLRMENLDKEKMTTEQLNNLRYQQLEAMSGFLGGMAGLFNQSSAAYKSFAIMQATLDAFVAAQKAYRNTLANPANLLLPDGGLFKAKIAYGISLAFGLAKVAVIASQKQKKYKDGTLFAERSGTAITDEEGAELHFDKNWKLKDKGSTSGARTKHVAIGDKIIDAKTTKSLMNNIDITKLIMIPTLPQIIDKNDKIDYDKLASKIAEKSVSAQEKQKKEHFLLDQKTGELIRIESRSGVRTVFRREPEKKTNNIFR